MQFITKLIATVIKVLTVHSLKHEGVIIILPQIMTILTLLVLAAIGDIITKFGIVDNFVQFAIRITTSI